MNLVVSQPNPTWTLAQLRRHFWMIPAERILLTPLPGTATEEDVVWMNDRGYRLCELVEGTLIGKTMGATESWLAVLLIQAIGTFVRKNDLGIVLGPDGFLRLRPGLIRAPDVSFISWDRLGGEFPKEATPDLAPDLAVEVISEHNTKKEMKQKLEEYCAKDVQLVWLVYPKARKVEVYTSPTKKRVVRHNQTLDGGNVLPGFELPLRELFTTPRRRQRRGRGR
jgi:Uma2 family endonuclease